MKMEQAWRGIVRHSVGEYINVRSRRGRYWWGVFEKWQRIQIRKTVYG